MWMGGGGHLVSLELPLLLLLVGLHQLAELLDLLLQNFLLDDCPGAIRLERAAQGGAAVLLCSPFLRFL
jgi:hypothetical protein